MNAYCDRCTKNDVCPFISDMEEHFISFGHKETEEIKNTPFSVEIKKAIVCKYANRRL